MSDNLPGSEHKVNPQIDKGFLDELVLTDLKKVRNANVVCLNPVLDTVVVMVVCFTGCWDVLALREQE